VRDFQFFITDDRYSLPTLRIVQAVSAVRASEMAERMFAEGPHHLGVEVYEDSLRVFATGETRQPDESQRRAVGGEVE
jgi:hypothetical protein